MGNTTGHHSHTYDNGDVYEGDFVNGKRQGNGRYTASGGSSYEGEWFNDQRHGYGIFTYTEKLPDGTSQWIGTYEGEWKNNFKNGQGTFNYASGDKFTGTWLDDKKYLGTYTYSNQDKYQGEFVGGLMHGQGVYTYANGDIIIGRWQQDVQDGICVFKAQDGSLREEKFSEGERLSSKPIGSADPLAISAELDAQRILRKVNIDLSQFHLIHRTSGASAAAFDTISPRVAPEPRNANIIIPPQRTAQEMLEQLALNQAQRANANKPSSPPPPAAIPSTSPPTESHSSTVTVNDTPTTVDEATSNENVAPVTGATEASSKEATASSSSTSETASAPSQTSSTHADIVAAPSSTISPVPVAHEEVPAAELDHASLEEELQEENLE